MLEQRIHEQTKEFIGQIHETDVYKNYETQLERIKRYPDLYDQVNEYRRKNFEIQSVSQADELYDKMENFEREYRDFRENTIVSDFLDAELAFCRMMQEISSLIVDELNFE